MSKSYNLILFIAIPILISCSTTKEVPINKAETIYLDSLISESPVIYWDKPTYELPILTWDLLHQRIHISVHPENQSFNIFTDLVLKNKPLEQNRLYLDAIGIYPDSVIDLSNNHFLRFDTTAKALIIHLDSKIQRGDTISVRIAYSVAYSGIGIHMVNPKNEFTDQPFQIWTQNQPDEIKYWLPTITSPSDKATMELWLDVPDSLTTIATGILLEKSETQKGRRTDYWRLQQAQSTYLWGFVIGKFEKTVQRYKNKLVEYYSDFGFKPFHSIMYKDVPKMLAFMEDFTGMEFPYDALRFVPIYDYDSAGMENTGMITLFDGVQFDSLAAIDIDNTGLLIHEIAHHWYGNTITINDWGSVALQEGLATWFELEYFRYQDDSLIAAESKWWNWYEYEHLSKMYQRAIVTPQYENPNELFDAYSYEKSALVFDYIRFLLGDDVFKSVLKQWLKSPQEQVNLAHFQKIVEEQSGVYWGSFFDQWFKKPGHPIVSISLFTEANKSLVKLSQTQNTNKEPIYKLNVPLSIIYSDSVKTIPLVWNSKDTLLTFSGKVQDVIYNRNLTAPIKIHQLLNSNQLINRLQNEKDVFTLINSIMNFEFQLKDSALTKSLQNVVETHPSDLVKSVAMEVLASQYTSADRNYFIKVFQSEKNGRTRIQALYALAQDSAATIDTILKSQLQKEQSYFMLAEIIKVGLQRNGELWIDWVKPFVTKKSYQNLLQSAIAQGLQGLDSKKAFVLAFQLASQSSKQAYVYESLLALSMMHQISERQKDALIPLMKVKIKSSDLSIKLLATKTLFSNPSQKKWVLDYISTLPESDQNWLNSEINKPEIEVEVNHE